MALGRCRVLDRDWHRGESAPHPSKLRPLSFSVGAPPPAQSAPWPRSWSRSHDYASTT